ncbi:MAG: hypothetical protein IIA68_12850, partial [Proteobacteria bacterium]|nr:hypothetical protein [Pseudomonadota bacterium]
MAEAHCSTEGCQYASESQVAMDVHQQGHKLETLTRQVAGLKESVDSQPGSLGAHFHSALEQYEQKHTHLSDVLEHATDDDCPECVKVKSE